MRRTGDVWVALALSAFATVACSDPHGGTLPTGSPTATSVSATPSTPSPTDYPAQLRLAIEQYYVALNAAAHAPAESTDALAARIAPGCECRKVIDLLRTEAASGRSLDYAYSVRDLRVIEAGELGGNATYVVVQTPGHERDRDGTILHTYPGSTSKFSVHFVRTQNGWLLDRATEVR